MVDGEADAWIVSAGKVAPIVRNIETSLMTLANSTWYPSLTTRRFKTFIFPHLSPTRNIPTSSHLERLCRQSRPLHC
jgi:hypothetical protein